MQNLIEFLKGKKTYLLVIGAFVYGGLIQIGVCKHYPQLDVVFAGATVLSLRAGIAKGPTAPLIAIACLLSWSSLTYAGTFDHSALLTNKSISAAGVDATPTSTSIDQKIADELQADLSSPWFEAFAYPEYGRALDHKFGGSIDIFHPINDNVQVGIGLTELDGGFFAAALGVTLKKSFPLFGSDTLQVTPFAEVAVESQFSGPNDNNLTPGALTAAGAYLRLWKTSNDNVEIYATGIAKWYSQYNLPDGPPTTLGFGAGVRIALGSK